MTIITDDRWKAAAIPLGHESKRIRAGEIH
jgi:hypothetical protein